MKRYHCFTLDPDISRWIASPSMEVGTVSPLSSGGSPLTWAWFSHRQNVGSGERQQWREIHGVHGWPCGCPSSVSASSICLVGSYGCCPWKQSILSWSKQNGSPKLIHPVNGLVFTSPRGFMSYPWAMDLWETDFFGLFLNFFPEEVETTVFSS